MDKEFIIKLLQSPDTEDKLKALNMLLEDKEEMLLKESTVSLESGFVIDNNIVNMDGILYNDITVYFIGHKLLSKSFESSLIITEGDEDNNGC